MKKFSSILIAFIMLMLGVAVGRLSAGSPDAPGGPTSPAAQMHTLEQIYQRISDGGTFEPAMTTFTSVTPRRAGRELLGQLGQRVALDRHVQDVAVLADHPPRHQLGLAATADRDDPVAVALVQISQRPAGPVRRQRALDQADRAGAVGPLRFHLLGDQPA